MDENTYNKYFRYLKKQLAENEMNDVNNVKESELSNNNDKVGTKDNISKFCIIEDKLYAKPARSHIIPREVIKIDRAYDLVKWTHEMREEKHLGYRKTVDLIAEKYYVLKLTNITQEVILDCKLCRSLALHESKTFLNRKIPTPKPIHTKVAKYSPGQISKSAKEMEAKRELIKKLSKSADCSPEDIFKQPDFITNKSDGDTPSLSPPTAVATNEVKANDLLVNSPSSSQNQLKSPILKPWEEVKLDLIELELEANQMNHLLILEDSFTQFIEIYSLESTEPDIILKTLDKFFSRWKQPNLIISNQSPLLSHIAIQDNLEKLNIKFKLMDLNLNLKELILFGIKLTCKDINKWRDYLLQVKMHINRLPSPTTNTDTSEDSSKVPAAKPSSPYDKLEIWYNN
ncbi:hypothetical protein CONCODRAFT_80340 [Conidiobolus coronatus NRRL 28638]|uniref:Integrase catalytic domain-containing protein n=1 Tax=Conidiobolus coronatus (strain ATCC 28846 / CBS 209.66 / NRRL 28638) TaxID=796925 RepID=A0A137NW10_CONC2|nr:hypothetical protein CONCODRAFT_80340 [Conidiobolus coronatus NRRL 28638]|eukprot:KXN66962.1 hypothetical protein CONCODRAFT_80340 [Conidiobolus coronatus NRRL 28638]